MNFNERVEELLAEAKISATDVEYGNSEKEAKSLEKQYKVKIKKTSGDFDSESEITITGDPMAVINILRNEWDMMSDDVENYVSKKFITQYKAEEELDDDEF